MGLAFGILGMTTFVAVFTAGVLLVKNSHKSEVIKELEAEISRLKGSK